MRTTTTGFSSRTQLPTRMTTVPALSSRRSGCCGTRGCSASPKMAKATGRGRASGWSTTSWRLPTVGNPSLSAPSARFATTRKTTLLCRNGTKPLRRWNTLTASGGCSVSDPVNKPRVVVSGWQTYDNKGRVVDKYEPFFSEGWEYKPPAEAQLGQKATMFYDPRGQVLRTVNPDGSEQRMVYGVPADLANPDAFAPTPWEIYTYDVNDSAGRTHPTSSTSYQNHRNTPTSTVVDALGRTVATVERNGPNSGTDWYTTRSTYDIRGNLINVTDPLGRIAFRHAYDLANRALRTEQLDAGPRRIVLDAAGNPVERRDSKGALGLNAHDALNRPVRLWARDGTGQALTLREWLIYGDSADSGLIAK